MSNSTHNNGKELPEAMLEEAAIWQARLREPENDAAVAQAVRADFESWLAQDSRHHQAFAEMDSLWGALETPVAQVLAEQTDQAKSITPETAPAAIVIPLTPQHQQHPQQETSQPTRPAVYRRLALAACLVLAVTTAIGWQQEWPLQWQSDYVTAIGEQVPLGMDDGSQVTLNTDSAMAVDYSESERRVRLLKGEAWFDVATDTDRPFIVETGAGAVRVTGTQFNVHVQDGNAIVSLDEGRVELSLTDALTGPVALIPGQQSVLSGSAISAPTDFDRTAVTAWMRGQFVFYDAPLSEVVATLNRYRPGRIVIANDDLNALKVSGIFSTNDPDAALDVITGTLPVRQTRLTDYLVLLR